MAQDFSELIEYLDRRFTVLDTAVENLDEKKADKKDVHELIGTIDAYAHKADKYFQEMAALQVK